MITIKTVTDFLEGVAPLDLQEAYDNSGLITGNHAKELTGALICLDCTEEVVDEALKKNANLIIAHHPILFSSIKSLTGKNYVERVIIKAIKDDIAIYAIHTNLDNIIDGVNRKLAEKIGLTNTRILRPLNNLQKLVTFIPAPDTDKVLAKLHEIGAGNIGNYSECSFKISGQGTFKPGNKAKPVIGNKNLKEVVEEDRLEIVFPEYITSDLVTGLKEAHPYEEVAYYITKIENVSLDSGAGMIGQLDPAMPVDKFLEHLRSSLSLACIRHTTYKRNIRTVAICGGAGSFLVKDAINQGADAFVTGDVKYHEFFDAEAKVLFCDVGHYESEVATKDLLFEMLTKKFTNFALHLSETVTNPIKYFK